VRFFIVDAFTSEPFKGNPAAVVLLEEELTDQRLQAIAVEFNLSETAFLRQIDNNSWSLRWFTPASEIELCGHATLASAHVLWQELDVSSNPLHFSTLSGLLTAKRNNNGEITLDFPAIPSRPIDVDANIKQKFGMHIIAAARAPNRFLIELSDADSVLHYQPDFELIRSLPERGLIVTAKGDNEFDFASRFFAPKMGIPEDPVTGSMHCVLAPYWNNKLGKHSFKAKQLSQRGGVLGVNLVGERVELIGSALTVMRGDIVI